MISRSFHLFIFYIISVSGSNKNSFAIKYITLLVHKVLSIIILYLDLPHYFPIKDVLLFFILSQIIRHLPIDLRNLLLLLIIHFLAPYLGMHFWRLGLGHLILFFVTFEINQIQEVILVLVLLLLWSLVQFRTLLILLI